MTQLLHLTVHARFNGRSEELPLSALQLEGNATDAQLKRALTSRFDLPPHALDTHVVVRTSQAIIVRPEAIYG